jgi:hypothetical protein
MIVTAGSWQKNEKMLDSRQPFAKMTIQKGGSHATPLFRTASSLFRPRWVTGWLFSEVFLAPQLCGDETL